MKNKILGLMFLFTLSFSSCDTLGQVYVDEYVSIPSTVIIQYGTPYYYNNAISYYCYNNRYYYPYIVNGRRYFRCYNTVRPRGFVYHHDCGRRYRDNCRFDGNRGYRGGGTPYRGHSDRGYSNGGRLRR